MNRNTQSAFSLVELSIVLVILGLLVGGILAGKSLIAAATIKSQINQITEFSIAARTFRDKYFYLPGDLPEPTATSAGFKARGALPGQGDGDGIISGWQTASPTAQYYIKGEPLLFWTDLSTAALISGNFTTATATTGMVASSNPDVIAQYMPRAKMASNFIFVTGGNLAGESFIKDGKSYLELQNITSVASNTVASAAGRRGLSVIQAYMIDSKFDDGNPVQGKVGAFFQNAWTIQGGSFATQGVAVPASATTCFDNGNNATGPVTYSLAFNSGEGNNCGLLFEGIN